MFTITPSLSVLHAHPFQKHHHQPFLLHTSFSRSYIQPCASARSNIMIFLAFKMSATVVHHGCSSQLFFRYQTLSLRLTKHCLGQLSAKSSAPPWNLPTFQFVEELEAMAKKIVHDREGARFKFTSMCMRSDKKNCSTCVMILYSLGTH